MMPYCIVNKKGFINAYIVIILSFILLLSQLYTIRFASLYQLQKITKSGYYCELFIFQHIQNKYADCEDIPNDASNQNMREQEEKIPDSTSDNDEEMENSEEIYYDNCQISFTYKEEQAEVVYRIQENRKSLLIELDASTKEILDVVYEKEKQPQ